MTQIGDSAACRLYAEQIANSQPVVKNVFLIWGKYAYTPAGQDRVEDRFGPDAPLKEALLPRVPAKGQLIATVNPSTHGGSMSSVVLGPAHPEQARQAGATAPRPRKGRPANGRRISISHAEPAEQIECRGCRHWRAFVAQWGHCGCELVRRHVDGEAPLVTRGSFSCRFFSPAAATTHKPKAPEPAERFQPQALTAAE